MTSATVTMAQPHPTPTLDRVATWLLLLFVASLQMSIFAAQILLTLMLVCWVALLIRDRARGRRRRRFSRRSSSTARSR